MYMIGNMTLQRMKMQITCRRSCFQSGRPRPLVCPDVFMLRKRVIGFFTVFSAMLSLGIALCCTSNVIGDEKDNERDKENDHRKCRCNTKPSQVTDKVVGKSNKKLGGS